MERTVNPNPFLFWKTHKNCGTRLLILSCYGEHSLCQTLTLKDTERKDFNSVLTYWNEYYHLSEDEETP